MLKTIFSCFFSSALVLGSPILSHGQACKDRPETSVRISFTGDILVHKVLFEYATRSSERFTTLWKGALSPLKSADFTVGNLEGAVAPGRSSAGATKDPGFVHDGSVYSGTNFLFNYHPYLLDDLKSSGFDFLTTSNNHSYDRGSQGIDRTIQEIQKRNLFFAGTRSKADATSASVPGLNSFADSFLISLNIKGIRFGFIACAEMLNGFRDTHSQVLACASAQVLELIKLSANKNEVTLVLPHWGYEYQPTANAQQRSWTKKWFNAGATAVIGNHPHVLQNIETQEWKSNNAKIVIYSLGNFVAGQRDIRRRTSAIANLDFVRGADGVVSLKQFSYTPILRPSGSYSVRIADASKDKAEWKIITEQLGPALCNPAQP